MKRGIRVRENFTEELNCDSGLFIREINMIEFLYMSNWENGNVWIEIGRLEYKVRWW